MTIIDPRPSRPMGDLTRESTARRQTLYWVSLKRLFAAGYTCCHMALISVFAGDSNASIDSIEWLPQRGPTNTEESDGDDIRRNSAFRDAATRTARGFDAGRPVLIRIRISSLKEKRSASSSSSPTWGRIVQRLPFSPATSRSRNS
jgi:hypothetical protein